MAEFIIQENDTADKLVAANERLAKALADANSALSRLCLPTTPTTTAAAASSTNRPAHWASTPLDWDPNGYCWTHGYKIKTNHNSANCSHRIDGHISTATRSNTKVGSGRNQGWTTARRFAPADSLNVDVACNTIANSLSHDPGCANPPNLSTTAFIDTAASKSLVMPFMMTSRPTSSTAITVIQPGSDRMRTTHTVDLLVL